MRNSSLVEWLCAENVTGLKSVPKTGAQAIYCVNCAAPIDNGQLTMDNYGVPCEARIEKGVAKSSNFWNEKIPIQSSPAGDTGIVNCQLSIVNCFAKRNVARSE